jgi:D-beta-D-heptose 7-phosphate kinase/D-beta-D-heptose 1-phosphate adenosyltransferase
MIGPLVIVGDSMLDVDIDGTVTRISPEAPVPVVDAERMWQRPGGAGLAAILAARSESDVVLVTALADDPAGRTLRALLRDAGVRVLALPLAGTTVCKTRIRARGQSVLRLDHGDGTAAAETLDQEVIRTVAGARAVLVSDYGNGITSHPLLRGLLQDVAPRIPVVWDPHPRGADPIPGAALVTPNEAEAQGLSAERLRERWQVHAVCVTLGDRGALLTTGQGGPCHVRAASGAVGAADTCGAGDRFAVAAAADLGSGADASQAVSAAVQAASRFVAAGGAAGVSSPAALTGGPVPRFDDTPVGTDIDNVARLMRRRGGRLVATGGCFDLLHTGHVRLLRRARDLGDTLVVLLNSDASVRRLKGPDRPVMAADDRARVLAALACVDAVCVFEEASPAAALDRLRPDIWVKGGDYRADRLPEAEVVARYGGEVVILPTVPGYSSSRLIASARNKEVS